jgi:chitin disaccharide deacetylase
VSRYLIVNADDFGQSPGINRGVARAHEEGIVTSASLMVRWPAAVEAAAYGRSHSELSLGLHVDLGEWALRDGEWWPLYEVSAEDAGAVSEEVNRQLAGFRRLVGADPTHLDSHQHAHRREPVTSVLLELARGLGVPLRDFSPRVRYSGDFYGQGFDGQLLPELIGAEGLIELLRSLPPGVTELGCHPGELGDLESGYLEERPREVETLCDRRVRAVLEAEGIELRSFHTAFD